MLRINGIVSTANRAKRGLSEGISREEVTQFKQFIQSSLQTIDELCKENNVTPSEFPIPSRKAYQFLKSIDFDNLPV